MNTTHIGVTGLIGCISTLFLLNSCSSTKVKEAENSSVRKELTDLVLCIPDSIPVDFTFNPERWNLQDSILWVIDSHQKPFLTGFNLKLKKKIYEGGNIGQGPDDYISPGIVEGNTHGPVIYSNTLNKVNSFKLEKDSLYLRSKGTLPLSLNNGQLPNPYTRIVIVNDTIYAGTYFYSRLVGVDLFNPAEGKLISRLPLSVEQTEETMSNPYQLKIAAYESDIVAAYRYMDFLEIFSLDNNGNVYLRMTIGDCSSPQNDLYNQGRSEEMIKYYSDVVCVDGKIFLLYQGVPKGKLDEADTTLQIFSLKDGTNLLNASLGGYYDQIQVAQGVEAIYLHSPNNEDFIFYLNPKL